MNAERNRWRSPELPVQLHIVHEDRNNVERHYVYTNGQDAEEKMMALVREVRELFIAQRPHLPLDETGSVAQIREKPGKLTVRQFRPGEREAYMNIYHQITWDDAQIRAWLVYREEHPDER